MKDNEIRSHEDLHVWKLSMQLASDIYRLTYSLPAEERFGLQSQLRRAAVSVASNIAGGAGRRSSTEFRHFLSIALGSLAELETQYLLCIDLRFLRLDPELRRLIKRIRVMLSRLKVSIDSRERIRSS
jgi:four helix bundle protein